MKRLSKNKVLAFVIAIMMIAALFPTGIFSVSATIAQGNAIKNAEDFAKMDPDGTYYLDESITLTETYAKEFTGNFNGNGHTITVSAPIFDQVMNATVENFKVVSKDDAVVTLADGGGMVCNKAGGNTTLRNITNTVSLQSTNSTTNHSLAGIVGDFVAGAEDSTVTIYGCVNKGNISANDTKGIAGGIVGGAAIEAGAYNVIVENCSNEGKIVGVKCGGIVCLFDKLTGSATLKNCQNSCEVTASSDLASGIIAQVTNSISRLEIYNCENNEEGIISTSNKRCGGIIAICQISGSDKVYISDCFNSGAITSTSTRGSCGGIAGVLNGVTMERCGNSGSISASDNAGGVIGSSDNDSNNGSTIRYCYNVGSATASRVRAAGIVGDANNRNTIITGCYNSGTITGIGAAGEIFGKTIITDTVAQVTKNYIKGTSNYATTYAEGDLKSGALTLAMNTAIGKTVYYQNINDKNTPTYPVTDPTHGYVFEYNKTLYSLAFFTLDGAGIRLDPVNHGIRFSTAVSKADYGVLTKAGITLDFGTIITPDEYLAAADNNFKALAEGKYLDVNSEATGIGVFREVKGEDNATYYFFCGSITGIKAANYDWDYSAIGYVTINGNAVYSANYTTRNAAYVANAALKDTAAGYTDAEKAILRGYLQ